MSGIKPTSFKRENFIQKLVSAGFTYDKAQVAYLTMLHSLESAIVERRKVVLGDIGVIIPKPMRPRRVVMSCQGGKVGASRTRKEYFLGARIKYRFAMHEAFGQKHGFNT